MALISHFTCFTHLSIPHTVITFTKHFCLHFSMSRRTHYDTKPCFHCYGTDHSTDIKCTRNGIISCTKCFRLNVFTAKCNCQHQNRKTPLQVLRLVGKPSAPRLYVDLRLHDIIVPALLNTALEVSRVNPEFANWWQSISTDSIYRDANTITVETVRKGLLMKIQCDVIDSQEHFIELGTDFMTAAGFSLTLEGVSVYSEHSPVLSNPHVTEYVYNLRHRGHDLRTYLSRKKFFLKQGRINKPSFKLPKSSQRTVIVRKRKYSRSSSDSRYWWQPKNTFHKIIRPYNISNAITPQWNPQFGRSSWNGHQLYSFYLHASIQWTATSW